MRFRRILLAAALMGALPLGRAAASQDHAVTLPGTNGLIVVDSGSGIVAINPATGSRSSLLGSDGGDLSPEVSPNGQKVAFHRAVGADFQVFMADFPSGNNRQQVTSGTATNAFVGWSPDSTTLVYSCFAELAACTSPAQSFAPRTVVTGTSAAVGAFSPDFTPDGQFITFQGAGGFNRVPASGGAAQTLFTDSAFTGQIRLSPDGTRAYFNDGTGILVVPLPGGSPSLLAGTGPGDSSAAPSPDGTKVAFTGAGSTGIFTVNANGTGGRSLVPGSLAGDTFPFWTTVSSATTPPVPANAAPVFSADSACGGSSILRLLPLFGPATASVSASDTAGQVVTLTASGAPSYVTFTSAAGNPATGTLSVTVNPLEFLNILFAAIAQTPSTVTVSATDNGTPVASSTCAKTVRIGIV